MAFHIRGVTVPIIVPARAECLIGREGGDIHPEINLEPHRGQELGVSRTHAIVKIVHQKVFLTDLNSTNGTQVNGRALIPRQPVQLVSGDEIRLGKLSLIIYFNLDAESENAPEQP
jgi:pSer/pThr/pTyr-binding forkhead associated (FHA) protein